jgi:hypothetical protein
MRWKLFFEFYFSILIFWIIAGDLFLPQPYRSGSLQLRTNINHFLVSLLPRRTIINLDWKKTY